MAARWQTGGRPLITKDQLSAPLQHNTSLDCGETSKQDILYIQDDKIYLLEEAKCCPAPAPNKHTPSTCQKANWWKILGG